MACNANMCIAVHCCSLLFIQTCTIRYQQRAQTTWRDKKVESSKGFLHDYEELGLLDEETRQQRPQSELEETHDSLLLDDIHVGGASCDSEGEDETAPLLDKTTKKQSKDENSREREKETKGDNKRERTGKAREKRVNDGKKEGERIPIRDTDESVKRDKEGATKRKDGVPRDTDKPEQDTEKIAKEREAKDIDGESIAKDKEKGGSRGGDDLEGDREMTATKKKKDTQTGTDKPETKDREEMVKEKERGVAQDRKDIYLAEAEVKGDNEGIGTEEIVKERKRGGPRNPDKGEARKEGETATKRKKKKHRDKNTSEIEDRGAKAKDGEDKVKEKNKGGEKDNKWRSKEKDNP